MVRFIDLSREYWSDREQRTPLCAFLSTSSDRFLENYDSAHVFNDMDEIREHPQANRLLRLLPEGFFETKETKR